MQTRKTHIQLQAYLLASVNTFFSKKILFPYSDNAETYITNCTYTLSEWKNNKSNSQEEWQNSLQGNGRNIVLVPASLCKAQLHHHLCWFYAFFRVNEHEECIQ